MKSSGPSDPNRFYDRHRREYEAANKPVHYEVDFSAVDVTKSKIRLLANKFVQKLKEGMREGVNVDDDEARNSYWVRLETEFKGTIPMDFLIQRSHEPVKVKSRLYFILLLHTRCAFETFGQIVARCPELYYDEAKKKLDVKSTLEPLQFLKDGQYILVGKQITDFDNYMEMRKEAEKLQEIQRRQREAKEKRQREFQQLRIAKQRKLDEQKRERDRLEQQKIKQLQAKLQNERSDSVAMEIVDFAPKQRTGVVNNPASSKVIKMPLMSDKMGYAPNSGCTKAKPSHILFEERYKDNLSIFHYDARPQLETDKTKCFECGTQLSMGLYFLGANQNYCNYSGQWYCNNHFSQERCPIPWRAQSLFDMKGYPVCRKSYQLLQSYYNKPLIIIRNEDSIVHTVAKLYEFLVIKRQLHLIYDSICHPNFLESVMKETLNYCLRDNLFSMKNLYDIYNGHQTQMLQQNYAFLSKHFTRCDTCSTKKGFVCPGCNDPVKIFPFEIRETQGCKRCRKLYHLKCLKRGKCPKCEGMD